MPRRCRADCTTAERHVGRFEPGIADRQVERWPTSGFAAIGWFSFGGRIEAEWDNFLTARRAAGVGWRTPTIRRQERELNGSLLRLSSVLRCDSIQCSMARKLRRTVLGERTASYACVCFVLPMSPTLTAPRHNSVRSKEQEQ